MCLFVYIPLEAIHFDVVTYLSQNVAYKTDPLKNLHLFL